MTSGAAHELVTALDRVDQGFVVVITGAGISLASGIPTFRGSDPDAVWKRDVTELATRRYFLEDPVGSWQWYTSRFDMVLTKEPNEAHRSLVSIERRQLSRGGRFLLVTQNIDLLHEKAGAGELVKVHGSADRVRCSKEGCVHGAPAGSLPRCDIDMTAFEEDPRRETAPSCPVCGSLLRPHVLWFDEMYDEHRDYQWPRVLDSVVAMELALFVGTSFSVGVTELFLEAGLRTGIPMFAIDPGVAEFPVPGMTLLREESEELLPAVSRILGAE